jgi:hypothetical protein
LPEKALAGDLNVTGLFALIKLFLNNPIKLVFFKSKTVHYKKLDACQVDWVLNKVLNQLGI